MTEDDLYNKGYEIGQELMSRMREAAKARIAEFEPEDQEIVGDGIWDAIAEY